MKKILAITTIRSDYSLVYELYRLLNNDPDIDLRILVSGAHMSKTYGFSVTDIEAHGFKILAKLETLIDSDSLGSRLKTASLLLQSSVDIVANFAPDLLIYAGDREDVIVGGLLGAYLEIPSVHFFGGDHVKDGHVDNPVRHATSKLSTFHFVSCEQHQVRLRAIGESADRIKNIGSIALDKFVKYQALSKSEIRRHFGFKAGFENFSLMIFHPIPEEREMAGEIASRILEVLQEENVNCFVSYPNTDPANRRIIEAYERFQADSRFHFYRNLPGETFLSVYKRADFIIGNSSSGVLEAASIPIPAINVGIRQQGRMAAENVLWTATDKEAIRKSVRKARDANFLSSIKDMKNPYGEGDSCKRAYQLIKSLDFKSRVLKKEDPLELQ